MRQAIAAVVVAAWMCGSVAAQPLADRVPADAMVYIAWQGTEAMPDGFDQTHLKGILDASNLPQLFETLAPSLLERIGREDPQVAQELNVVSSILGAVLRHRSAFYLGPVDLDDPMMPLPRAAIFVQAGDEAAALQAQLSMLLRGAAVDLPVVVERRDELVVMRIGELAEAENLAGSPRFQAALGRVHGSPVAMTYIDVERLIDLVNEVVAGSGDPEAERNWPILRDVSGIGGVTELIWTGGFEGQEWVTQAFIGAPAPRRGLVGALLDMPGLSEEALDVIPRRAVLASASRFNPGRVLQEVFDLIRQIEPEAGNQLDDGLQMLHGMVGVDVQQDLLEALGDEWMVYASPDVGGGGMLGMVVVNRLRDAARLEQSLEQITAFANQQLAMLAAGGDGPRIRVAQMRVGEMTVHHVPVPLVSPALAIRDGNLYLALYPQVVVAAAEHVSGGGESIRLNEKFQAVRQRVGAAAGDRLGAVSFADLPATAGESYQSILMLSQMYLGLAELFGVDVPAMVIPPLHQVLPHLVPSGGATWSDEDGLHMRGVSPFPAAEMLGMQQNMMVSQQAMMVAMLLPALNRSRETANRVRCASNMRQIGLGVIMYSNENRMRFPNDLGELLLTQDVTIDVFFCPTSHQTPPRHLPLAQQAEWVKENADYVWLGAGMTNAVGSDVIIMHERFENHGGQGVNVLFGDAHVEWLTIPELQRRLAAQQQRQR